MIAKNFYYSNTAGSADYLINTEKLAPGVTFSVNLDTNQIITNSKIKTSTIKSGNLNSNTKITKSKIASKAINPDWLSDGVPGTTKSVKKTIVLSTNVPSSVFQLEGFWEVT